MSEFAKSFLSDIYLLPGGVPHYTDVVAADHPIAWYKLNDTTNLIFDSGSGAVNGSYVSGSYSGVTQSEPSICASDSGSCTYFNANVQGVIPPNTVLNLNNNFTVEALIKCTTQSPIQHAYAIFMMPNQAMIGLDNGTNYPSTPGCHLSWPGSVDYGGTSPALDDNAPHHLVMTLDGSNNFAIWVDGVKKVTGSGATFWSSFGSSYLGFQSGPVNEFGGYMQHVAVYSGVLSNTRIAAHYNSFANAYSPAPSPLSVSIAPLSVATPANSTASGVITQSFTANAAGGTPAYSYAWSIVTSDSEVSISGSSTGASVIVQKAFTTGETSSNISTARCKVVDSFSMSASSSGSVQFQVTPFAALPLSATISPVNGYASLNTTNITSDVNMQIALTANPVGGTPPYTYAWSLPIYYATTTLLNASAQTAIVQKVATPTEVSDNTNTVQCVVTDSAGGSITTTATAEFACNIDYTGGL